MNLTHDNLQTAPIHELVRICNVDGLRELLKDENCDVNVVDAFGNTALHLAARQNNVEITTLLCDHPSIDLNKLNLNQESALQLACKDGNTAVICELLKRPNIDLDFISEDSSPSEYRSNLLHSLSTNPNDILLVLLEEGHAETFIKLTTELVKVRKEILDDVTGQYTFLQLACKLGHEAVARNLLELGANPNQTTSATTTTPLMISAEQGHPQILHMLLQNARTSFNGATLWDSLFRGIMASQKSSNFSHKSSLYRRCLEYIMQKSHHQLQIEDGFRWAIELDDAESVKSLTDAGAYIGMKSADGTIPLTSMNASLLRRYLDMHLSDRFPCYKTDYTIVFDYTMLLPPSDLFAIEKKSRKPIYSVVSETEPLLKLSNVPELRELIGHPVLASFLHLKWTTVAIYFYLNLLFYGSLCVSLSSYIYVNDVSSYDLPALLACLTESPNTSQSTIGSYIPRFLRIDLLWITTYLLYGALLLRESYKFSIAPLVYLKSPETWVQLCLVGSAGVLLNMPTGADLRCQFASVASFSAWMGFVLLLGRLPSLSSHVELYISATAIFLKSLIRYTLLLSWFAFGYYIFLKYRLAREVSSSQVSFPSIIQSFITTMAQFPDESIPLWIRVVLLFLVVFDIIALLNLNGSAISKARSIQASASLQALVSRVKFIVFMETTVTNIPLPINLFLNRISRYWYGIPERSLKKPLKQRISLIPYLDENQIWANVYGGNDWKIPSNVLKDAMKILHDKKSSKGSQNSAGKSYEDF